MPNATHEPMTACLDFRQLRRLDATPAVETPVSIPLPRARNAWVIACAGGEQAYAVAAALLRQGRGRAPRLLASDISHRHLAQARRGVYPARALDHLPQEDREAYFEQQGDCLAAGPALRHAIRFRRIHLTRVTQLPRGPFDLVVCRDLLTHFDRGARAWLTGALCQRLTPGGQLLLGRGETLDNPDLPLRLVAPGAYEKHGGSYGSECRYNVHS